jgi:hypothetical protein
MTKNDDLELDQEPDILPIWDFARPDPPDDHQPQGPDRDEETQNEAFWAGRNHAMRRSARWAA